MRQFVILALISSSLSMAVFAQDTQTPSPEGDRPLHRQFNGVAGKLTALNSDSLTLTAFDGKTVTVKLTPDTRFMRDRQPAKLADFKIDEVVFVMGDRTGDSTWTARMVGHREGGPSGPGMMMNREDLGKKFIAGEVIKIEDTKLTLKRIDGVEQTVEVDEDTSFRNMKRESITLQDIRVGDHVGGPGELKDGVFVARELHVGMPPFGRMGGHRGDGQPTPPAAPESK